MKQNPFSLYDFLGYVFPGALSIILICFFHQLDEVHSINNLFEDGMKFLELHATKGSLEIVEDTIILTIISYVIGHIIAYLSSVTVEQYSQWLFGFPSFFLLNKAKDWLYWRIGENRTEDDFKFPKQWQGWFELMVRGAIGLFLFPVTICYLLIGKLMNMKYYFVKPLDKTLTDAIYVSTHKLAKSLGITIHPGDDFHRVIYHYEYELQEHHAPKMDNYVALYGFLRALTFIMTCVSVWILWRYVLPTLNFNAHMDWPLVRLFMVSIVLTCICFMGFMKFYRRFTLECFMCLVIDSSFKDIERIPYSVNYTEGNISNNTTITETAATTMMPADNVNNSLSETGSGSNT